MSKKCPKGKVRHHIKPESLGGTDDPDNIACVTPKQHKKIHKSGKMKGKTKSGRTVRYDDSI